jgi:hypothetical protein
MESQTVNNPYLSYSKRSKVNRINKLLCDTPKEIKNRFQYDDEGLWSFTNLEIGEELANRLLLLDGITKDSSLTELFGGIGGNTISFAKKFAHVDVVELSSSRYRMLRMNTKLFGLSNVSINHGYYQSHIAKFNNDIVYFDPPWGPDYKEKTNLRITISDGNEKIPLEIACRKVAKKYKPKYILLKLPLNYDYDYLLDSIDYGEFIWSKDYPRPNSMKALIIDTRTY